jgi:hypothetical protein
MVAIRSPDVLRHILHLGVSDQTSPEVMRNIIQAFQSSYARHPELLPFNEKSDNLVEIQCFVADAASEKCLQAVLSVGWSDDGKPTWLMAEVRWSLYDIGLHVQDETAWWSEVVYLDNRGSRASGDSSAADVII